MDVNKIMKRTTFQEWVKVKESEVVMGNRCVKDGADYQVAGDPCASAKLEPGKKLLLDKKKQKKT